MNWDQSEKKSREASSNQINESSEVASAFSRPAVPFQLKASEEFIHENREKESTGSEYFPLNSSENAPKSFPAPPIQLKSEVVQRKADDEEGEAGMSHSSSGNENLPEEEL